MVFKLEDPSKPVAVRCSVGAEVTDRRRCVLEAVGGMGEDEAEEETGNQFVLLLIYEVAAAKELEFSRRGSAALRARLLLLPRGIGVFTLSEGKRFGRLVVIFPGSVIISLLAVAFLPASTFRSPCLVCCRNGEDTIVFISLFRLIFTVGILFLAAFVCLPVIGSKLLFFQNQFLITC